MSRRTVLRGMWGGTAVALAVPVLDVMLDSHGTAWADGTAIPKRFGVWFWGNGTILDEWIPDQTGPDWQAKTQLQPLAGVKEYVSVVTGTSLGLGFDSAHHVGKWGMLSGDYDLSLGSYGRSRLPSCDQIAADHIASDTPFRSIEVGVSQRGFENSQTSSSNAWIEPTSVLPAEHSPRDLFNRLFGMGIDPMEIDPVLLDGRRSVLDVVRADALDLQAKLGMADRARLEQHLEGIWGLEQKLSADLSGCSIPEEPQDYEYVANQEQLEPKNEAMSQLIALALACDLTRVFNVAFTGMQTDTFYWQTGAPEGLHTMTHDGSMQGHVGTALEFVMQNLGYFLQTLRDIPIGDGSLLDHCAILCTSEVAEGYSHSTTDIPILVVGRAGGALRSGIHYRSTTEESPSQVTLTMLQAVGAQVSEYGGNASATEPLSALLV